MNHNILFTSERFLDRNSTKTDWKMKYINKYTNKYTNKQTAIKDVSAKLEVKALNQGKCEALNHDLWMNSLPLWPSAYVLCCHLLMLVDLPGNYSDTTFPLCGICPRRNLSNKSDSASLFWLESTFLWKLRQRSHNLPAWLINDVSGWDEAKAWASHLNSVKTKAPTEPLRHLL